VGDYIVAAESAETLESDMARGWMLFVSAHRIDSYGVMNSLEIKERTSKGIISIEANIYDTYEYIKLDIPCKIEMYNFETLITHLFAEADKQGWFEQ
jgi:hypothetical protein